MSQKNLTNLFYKATDTFRELFAYLAIVIVIAGVLFALFEHMSVWKGIWWALITAFTVGYGDTVPHTHAGEILTAVLLSFSVFLFVPLIVARFTKIAVVNDDAFTHGEQQQLKRDIAYIRRHIEAELDKEADKPKVDVPAPQKTSATYTIYKGKDYPAKKKTSKKKK